MPSCADSLPPSIGCKKGEVRLAKGGASQNRTLPSTPEPGSPSQYPQWRGHDLATAVGSQYGAASSPHREYLSRGGGLRRACYQGDDGSGERRKMPGGNKNVHRVGITTVLLESHASPR